MYKSLVYIFSFLALGEIIKYVFNIPIAGNIIAMILIFTCLKLKIIKLSTVKPAADALIKYMVLFFIPYGVGMMVYFDVLKENWIPIIFASLISTIITLYLTAIIQQKLEKK
ncbi:MAG: murein hydrolase transporter LrgA [Flavobacteriaceae bacterium]|nr:MAG: murein hydrolase transporter LrgA [Flavobacteriaceae bacterium]